MSKKGQHNNDVRDQDIARSRNNPKKSMPITTGTYKKPETYKKQAALHQDPGKKPQPAKPLCHPDTRELLPHEADSRERALEGPGAAAATPTPIRGHGGTSAACRSRGPPVVQPREGLPGALVGVHSTGAGCAPPRRWRWQRPR